MVQALLAGCTALPDLPRPAIPTPTATPQPTATATPAPTAATPTARQTPTPAIVILKTPRPRDPRAPEPTPAGDLIAYTDHVDFYAEPGSFWARGISDIGPAIEAQLRYVAERLRTEIPDNRITVSIQDPATSPLVRGMNCPARGLYFGPANGSALVTIFADARTSRVQVIAVAAHEFAHHLTFRKFGEGGDIILTEGLANWASRDAWSAWQGWPTFGTTVRHYRQRGIYLPLDETLAFDPAAADDLGLSDCFALRDLRYNEWTSFVDYLVREYGFGIIAELWRTATDDRSSSPGERYVAPLRPRIPSRRSGPGDVFPSRPDRAPTVDYAGVLGKTLPQLEQDWLRWLYTLRAQSPTLSSIP